MIISLSLSSLSLSLSHELMVLKCDHVYLDQRQDKICFMQYYVTKQISIGVKTSKDNMVPLYTKGLTEIVNPPPPIPH